jgi:hypothetical protein
MITYNPGYPCPNCVVEITLNGYSLIPDDPPLVLEETCANCGKTYQFSVNGDGEISVEEQ